jgi:hypothetical protein
VYEDLFKIRAPSSLRVFRQQSKETTQIFSLFFVGPAPPTFNAEVICVTFFKKVF